MSRRNAATYGALSGGRSARSEPQGFLAALTAVVAREGSVAGAARSLDVPRRTLRRWLTGEGQPSDLRRAAVVRRASQITRRARLTTGREARILRGRVIEITAAWQYDVANDAKRRSAGKARTDNTRVLRFSIGSSGSTGIDADVRQELVDAFLDGASGTDPGAGLFAVIADAMTDDWYRERFALPTSHGDGWDVQKVRIL